MLQISVNGLTQPVPSPAENWGELLDSLENGGGTSRQVVTAVRFGGVAIPTFREPVALGRRLGPLGVIDVQMSTVDELLHESAQAAYASIPPLKHAAQRIAASLRAGSDVAARRDLPALTASTQTLTAVTSGLTNVRASVEPHGTDIDALVQRLCRIIDSVVAEQAGGRWTRVADVLERDLAPTLDAWVLVARRVWNLA